MRWTMKPKDIYLQAVRYIMLQLEIYNVTTERYRMLRLQHQLKKQFCQPAIFNKHVWKKKRLQPMII